MLFQFEVDQETLDTAEELLDEIREDHSHEDSLRYLVESFVINVLMCRESGMTAHEVAQVMNHAYGAVEDYYYSKKHSMKVH